MTGKERILATMAGEPVDRIPVHHLTFSADAAAAILGRPAYVGGAVMQWWEMQAMWEGPDAHAEYLARCREDAIAIAEACGHDMLRLQYWRWTEKPADRIDEHTFLFGDPEREWKKMTFLPDVELWSVETGRGPLAGPVEAEEELSEEAFEREVVAAEEAAAAYEPPPGPHPDRKAENEAYPWYLIRQGAGAVGIGLFNQRRLMQVALWPELYARMLMAEAERHVKDVPRLGEAGMKVNFAGGDFCSSAGPCVSPETYRRVVLPAEKRIVDAHHEHGIRCVYVSDGNFWPVADIFFNEAGLDGWLETDRSAGMELRPLRERYPHAAFFGNIRVQVLHRGSADDVKREVNECLELAHELGRVVVGASNQIVAGTPPENILTMLKAIEDSR